MWQCPYDYTPVLLIPPPPPSAADQRKRKIALKRMISLLRSRRSSLAWCVRARGLRLHGAQVTTALGVVLARCCRYFSLLSAALIARSYTSMKLYRQIGVLGALLAKRGWTALAAAQVRTLLSLLL